LKYHILPAKDLGYITKNHYFHSPTPIRRVKDKTGKDKKLERKISKVEKR